MENLETFYTAQRDLFSDRATAFKKKLSRLSTLRLLVFTFTGFGIYYAFDILGIALGIGVLGIALFLFLLIKYTNAKKEWEFYRALVTINEEELRILKRDFYHRDLGLRFNDTSHFFCYDIDLFGKGSLYQYANRTFLEEGSSTFAHLLKANDIENIHERQEVIKELAKKVEWRQFFSAKASLIKTPVQVSYILKWLKEYKTFIPKSMMWLPIAFRIVSLGLIGLSIWNYEYLDYLGYWLILGLAITGIYLKKINVLAADTDKAKDLFRQYALLLKDIEKEQFASELLKKKQEEIKNHDKKASIIFRQFSKYLDALDNRNNMIGALFGNGLFLTDLGNSFKIEKWIKEYRETVSHWFEVVAFFDAYNSLGNFAFNHPQYVYPVLVEDQTCVQAQDLGHPLLHPDKRVNSNIAINQEEFFIVTGANMAGKSTFLRTISLHIVMANTGLPVCATASNYKPIKLITSMRTSDSLSDDSSYFFSELSRLKVIVEAIKEEPYFIILDEILKGTNSTDKAIGSKKFVTKLVASHATGIIATHDLSLCEIEEELPEVKNYFFDAQIVNDELFFDYILKKGICQNMNASFLLKKMEII